MKLKNEAIGEVECPHKGCTLKVAVFKFRARGGKGAARFAGKLYCDCPTHGRYGADGKEGAQSYILENAKLWSPNEPAPTPAPAALPVPAPVKSSTEPQAKPRSPWRPIIE